jgi:cystathionine gamma-synthase
MKIETKAVHAGPGRDPATGAIAPPIHLSTTFEHGPASEEIHGYMCIRDKNPTQDRLEEAMSELEGGEGALVFSSGMGAAAALLQHP